MTDAVGSAGHRHVRLPGPLRHPWFAAFVGAVSVGATAAELRAIVLPLLALELTHSFAVAAALRFVEFVPYVFFGAVSGVLIDRADKRRVLVAADALSCVLSAAIPISALLGAFSLELVFVVAFLLGACEVVWYLTSDFSIVPALVHPAELTAGNAAYQSAERIAHVAGPALAGIGIAWLGTTGAMWIAAAAFIPTLAVAATMPPVDAPRVEDREPLTAVGVGRDVRAGFAFIGRSAILRALVVFQLITNLGNTGIQTLLLFVLAEEHHLDPLTIGLALAATGLAQVAGSLAAPWLARGRPLGRTILGVVLAAGFGAAIAAVARDWRLIAAAVGVRQGVWAAQYVYLLIPRQREIPVEIRGQVNGSFRTVILASTSASAPFLSAIQGIAGSPAAFGACALLALAAATIAYLSRIRDYDIRAPAEADASSA
ncbi:MAG TPA: MFS transporter [Candidatus Limnocylindria bacterium]